MTLFRSCSRHSYPVARLHVRVSSCWEWLQSEAVDAAQDVGEQISGYRDFDQLKRDVATMRQTASSAGIANFRFWLLADSICCGVECPLVTQSGS